jgi:hypothetical protein
MQKYKRHPKQSEQLLCRERMDWILPRTDLPNQQWSQSFQRLRMNSTPLGHQTPFEQVEMKQRAEPIEEKQCRSGWDHPHNQDEQSIVILEHILHLRQSNSILQSSL